MVGRYRKSVCPWRYVTVVAAADMTRFWWADPEKGVAGMLASQVMPFGDMQVMGQWGACEAAVYSSLA